MGQGIDAAIDSPEQRRHMENFRDQLLIALAKKYRDGNNQVTISVHDVDMTGDSILMLDVNQMTREFTITVVPKQ